MLCICSLKERKYFFLIRTWISFHTLEKQIRVADNIIQGKKLETVKGKTGV